MSSRGIESFFKPITSEEATAQSERQAKAQAERDAVQAAENAAYIASQPPKRRLMTPCLFLMMGRTSRQMTAQRLTAVRAQHPTGVTAWDQMTSR
jgi:hypothetical protein